MLQSSQPPTVGRNLGFRNLYVYSIRCQSVLGAIANFFSRASMMYIFPVPTGNMKLINIATLYFFFPLHIFTLWNANSCHLNKLDSISSPSVADRRLVVFAYVGDFGLNDLLTLFAGVLSFLSLNLWTLLKDIVGFKLLATDV